MLLSSLITSFTCLYLAFRILELKIDYRFFIWGFVFGLLLFFKYDFHYYRILSNYVLLIIFLCFISKIHLLRIASVVLLIFIIFAFAEIIYFLVLSLFWENVSANLISNILISLLSYLIFLIGKKFWKKVNQDYWQNNWLFGLLLFCLVAIIGFLLHRLYYEVSLWLEFLISGLLLFVIGIFLVFLFQEKLQFSKVVREYDKLVNCLGMYEKTMSDFYKNQHEYQNELIFLRQYVKNKEASAYIDEQLRTNQIAIRFSKLPSVGLKGVLENKIEELNNFQIKVNFWIADDLPWPNYSFVFGNKIAKVLAILLDNAKQASLENKNPQVGVFIYQFEKKFVFSITNNYGEKMVGNFMEEKISTKGWGRGFGLALVQKIINEEDKLLLKTTITNQIFKQELFILD